MFTESVMTAIDFFRMDILIKCFVLLFVNITPFWQVLFLLDEESFKKNKLSFLHFLSHVDNMILLFGENGRCVCVGGGGREGGNIINTSQTADN